MNEEQEIKKGFIQIPNEVITEIFMKGLLGLTEIRIAAYIIRFSLGFHREWTNNCTVQKMADDIGISRSACSRAINKMIKENKIIKRDCQFKFNESYKSWGALTDCNGRRDLVATPVLTNCNAQSTNSAEQNNSLNTPKYTFKYILNKKERNVKERKIIKDPFLKEIDFKDKEEGRQGPTAEEKAEPAPTKTPAEAAAIAENSPAPAKISFNNQVFKFENIPREKLEKWKEAFPRANVEAELKKMEAWLAANPKNKKENYERFIVNWLGRADDRPVPKKEPERVERTGFYDVTGRRID